MHSSGDSSCSAFRRGLTRTATRMLSSDMLRQGVQNSSNVGITRQTKFLDFFWIFFPHELHVYPRCHEVPGALRQHAWPPEVRPPRAAAPLSCPAVASQMATNIRVWIACVLAFSFRDNELKSLLEMRGVTGAPMSWVRDGVEGDEVRHEFCSHLLGSFPRCSWRSGCSLLFPWHSDVWRARSRCTQTAFMEIDLPTVEDAKFLGSRSVSIKGIFEPWGSGSTCEECLQAAKVKSFLLHEWRSGPSCCCGCLMAPCLRGRVLSHCRVCTIGLPGKSQGPVSCGGLNFQNQCGVRRRYNQRQRSNKAHPGMFQIHRLQRKSAHGPDTQGCSSRQRASCRKSILVARRCRQPATHCRRKESCAAQAMVCEGNRSWAAAPPRQV
jgi:hypothetical protein